jgi:hypothetical protein
MKKMPEGIKSKLRRLQKLIAQSSELQQILTEDFKRYGVDIDVLTAISGLEVETEAFTFITYNEGDIEDNINKIEEVFLHYANKKYN